MRGENQASLFVTPLKREWARRNRAVGGRAPIMKKATNEAYLAKHAGSKKEKRRKLSLTTKPSRGQQSARAKDPGTPHQEASAV